MSVSKMIRNESPSMETSVCRVGSAADTAAAKADTAKATQAIDTV